MDIKQAKTRLYSNVVTICTIKDKLLPYIPHKIPAGWGDEGRKYQLFESRIPYNKMDAP